MSDTRKISAILVADVVGYSRLAGADEDRILARLRALRSDLIMERTRVRLDRLIAARLIDWAARLSTDFLRFFTFVAVP
jgi:class 3 adenylate cyclase